MTAKAARAGRRSKPAAAALLPEAGVASAARRRDEKTRKKRGRDNGSRFRKGPRTQQQHPRLSARGASIALREK